MSERWFPVVKGGLDVSVVVACPECHRDVLHIQVLDTVDGTELELVIRQAMEVMALHRRSGRHALVTAPPASPDAPTTDTLEAVAAEAVPVTVVRQPARRRRLTTADTYIDRTPERVTASVTSSVMSPPMESKQSRQSGR